MFPDFWELFQQFSKPEEGVREPPSAAGGQKPRWIGRWLVSQLGGGSCGTEPLTCVSRHCLHVNSVRIESNCRTSSWCRRELLDVGKNVHAFGDQKCQK